MKLHNIQNSKKLFSLLDFSRVSSLAQSLGFEIDHLENNNDVTKVTEKLMRYLSSEVSGVVVDPDFNFDIITQKSNGTGLLLSLEKKSSEIDPLALPILASNWGIEHVSNNYALAKLELYYNPQELEATKKKQFVAEIYDYCKYEGIDLLLELMVYHQAEEYANQEIMLEAQLESAKEFSNSVDIFALEYLGNALSAVTLTAELDTPWIYNARQVEYDEFKQNLRICLESGAQGFMAGDPFWIGEKVAKRLLTLKKDQELEDYIKTEMRDKVVEVVRIIGDQSTGNN